MKIGKLDPLQVVVEDDREIIVNLLKTNNNESPKGLTAYQLKKLVILVYGLGIKRGQMMTAKREGEKKD